ncbi:uncharacterized protein LOC114262730 isoform X2 [Camellia sinensis]|uniref:uncharacterized protein LOC114262730 isoform X2 n=1 Tax=Camellia sinensis TaxID=4442 RepID=UPI0010367470|nr:uncharacterized protein LOC114262730 isoform X2 [Camellia sinensis]
MAAILHFLILVTFISNPSSLFNLVSASHDDFSIIGVDSELLHQDYAPPAPPPPPPHPPSVSCEDDLGGIGSLDTTCQIVSDLNLTGNVYIQGKGNFYILSRRNVNCLVSGCEITINITGNFSLGENGTIVAGTFELAAYNASFGNGSLVNTTGLAGSPPPQTSGTPQGIDGAGGGHGGRGAACLTDQEKLQEDVWGGDAYSWSSLQKPCSYGSKGGTTSKEVDYGGGGGGRIKLEVVTFLEVNGSLMADGGDGGPRGGGGSGGSIFIKTRKMTGGGRISACGGSGFAGGGGGRVSVDVFSRHDDPKIFVHGGGSSGCSQNSGAAGTFYDTVPRSLIVSNHNMSTDTDTLLMEFPHQPLMTNVYIRNHAKATVPLLWSRVQVQGQISLLCGGVLSFGLAHYALSEFELLAEELLMSESVIKVYGALRMSVKMFLMWNSTMLIDGGGDANVETSLVEASNLVVLRESSIIHSNANLGVHGQGLLNLSGPGDCIEAQRLVLSLFYSIYLGLGSVLRGPLEDAKTDAVTPRLNCELQSCPIELLHPPEDCNVNSSLSFTLQICRVEDILVEGRIEGSVVHFHRARTIAIDSLGAISASGMDFCVCFSLQCCVNGVVYSLFFTLTSLKGERIVFSSCTGGVGRGKVLSSGPSSGGGHGGIGGVGCYNDTCIEGGIAYGDADLPCELGSGSGNESLAGSTAGGGIIVMGSREHPLLSLSVEGSVASNGETYGENNRKKHDSTIDVLSEGPGGGSGGTILMFLRSLVVSESGVLSSAGGHGSQNCGGGGGGRIHFHWADIPTGDVYQPIASVEGNIHTRGGLGRDQGGAGENGTVTGKACPKGLYGTFCEECPAGTYKNDTGSDKALCRQCPASELPHRAVYIVVRGGIAETPCPYECISDRYHIPHCYTALEELMYTFGGPWVFGFLLVGLLVLLALVLSVARMKFVGVDELPGPAPTQHGSQIDQSFPFLESLNEVLETNRNEESQSHVHRMYFMGPNTFSEPWHLPHTPPEQVKEIVYEGEFNGFVDEINAIASYQWWEGSLYSILCILAYPLAWSWLQWRRRIKLQRLREFVRSEYDHACLRSCRSRALYEGLKVAATSDLMLAFVDFFLGGDEKRTDLPPRLHQRFPIFLLFGGDGSYMAPFSLQSDNIITSLMSQSVPPTTWYRFVAGLNAQLRLVCRGRLKVMFRPVLRWLETHANPALRIHGVRVDLAWFQATTSGYCQYGLLVHAVEEEIEHASFDRSAGATRTEQQSRSSSIGKENPLDHQREEMLLSQSHRSSENLSKQMKIYGGIVDTNSVNMIEEKNIYYPFSFIMHNTKPVGHQDLVGLVISMLLLGDFSLVLLTLLQLYSISLVAVFLVLFILPLGILLPFPAGINALFSSGPRRSAGLARVYALWNLMSLVNVVVAFVCGYFHYNTQSSKRVPSIQPWNFSMDESEWWIFPLGLVLCKCTQSRLINWHVANLEIQDRSLYSNNFELFWQS